MTPDEWAATLGNMYETTGADDHIKVWRGEIADAIRAAVAAEREACAAIVDRFAQDPHEGWFAKELAATIRRRGGPP